MKLSPRRIMAATAVAGGLALLSPSVTAHDVVVGGNPADGQELDTFPGTIVLEFSGEPRQGFSTVALSDVDTGEVFYSGEPDIDGRNVILDVPADAAQGPGDYRIGFQIISSDGHSTRGMTTFSVAGADGSGTPVSESANTGEETVQADDGSSSSASMPVIAAAIAGALVVVAVAVVAVRKNRQSSDTNK